MEVTDRSIGGFVPTGTRSLLYAAQRDSKAGGVIADPSASGVMARGFSLERAGAEAVQ